jgi:hypothetical protein
MKSKNQEHTFTRYGYDFYRAGDKIEIRHVMEKQCNGVHDVSSVVTHRKKYPTSLVRRFIQQLLDKVVKDD